MKRALSAVMVCGVILGAWACGGGAAPPHSPDELPTDSADAAPPTSDRAALPVEMPPSATSGSGAGEVSSHADAGSPSPNVEHPAQSRSMEECATLARFPDSSIAADAGAGGPKTVVPWMIDPFGDQGPKTGKADKSDKAVKPAKKPPVDKGVEALRASFRKCYDTAKKTDPTQVVGISFERKPKGGQHEVCVKVKREEGKEDVTRVMVECMLGAIKDWAAKAP